VAVVVVAGLSHRSAPLDLLESLAVGPEALPKALHALASGDHLDEVVLVSTCMRTEVYAVTGRFHAALGEIRGFLSTWSGHPPEVYADHVYEYSDEAAVAHLFRVAAGLDSAVLGEGEILRQVRGAWEAARREGTVGPVSEAVFRRAVEAGKRVRSETAIARGTTSLSHTAVMLAGEHLAAVARDRVAAPLPGSDASGPGSPGASGLRPSADAAPCPGADTLRDRRALVLGAGEMGAAVAGLLAAGPGIAGVVIANRTEERAREVAAAIGATAAPWDRVAGVLAGADLVVSATAAPGPVLDAGVVSAALARRPDRPMVLVDLARPRDVDPAVGDLPGVTLLGMEDLQARADAAVASRRGEVPAAEVIVAEEVRRWGGAVAERDLVPIVTALRRRAEEIRRAELDRLAPRLAGLDPAQQRAVESLTRGLVAKLLHEPTVNLKAAAGDERAARLAAALAELWGLTSAD